MTPKPRMFRLPDVTMEQIAELIERWGMSPRSAKQVIVICVDRAVSDERMRQLRAERAALDAKE